MNSVVDAVRKKYPGVYDDLSDDDLTLAIGKSTGAYTDVPDFSRQFNELAPTPSFQPKVPVAPPTASTAGPGGRYLQLEASGSGPTPTVPDRGPVADVTFPDRAREEFIAAAETQRAQRSGAAQGQPPAVIGGNDLGALTQPLLDIAQPVTTEDLTTLGVPEKAAKVLAGAQQGVAGAVNFFTSPIGVATLGLGSLPVAAQRAVTGAFMADMVRQYPEIASNLADAVSKGDTEQAVKWATTGALNTLFLREGVKHITTSPAAKASEAIGYALQERLKDPELKAAMSQAADESALEAGRPGPADLTNQDLKFLARTRAPIIEDQPANLVVPGQGSGPTDLVLPETMKPGAAELEREMAELGKQMQAARFDGNAPQIDRLRRRMTEITLDLNGLSPERAAVGLDDLSGQWPPDAEQLGTFQSRGPTPYRETTARAEPERLPAGYQQDVAASPERVYGPRAAAPTGADWVTAAEIDRQNAEAQNGPGERVPRAVSQPAQARLEEGEPPAAAAQLPGAAAPATAATQARPGALPDLAQIQARREYLKAEQAKAQAIFVAGPRSELEKVATLRYLDGQLDLLDQWELQIRAGQEEPVSSAQARTATQDSTAASKPSRQAAAGPVEPAALKSASTSQAGGRKVAATEETITGGGAGLPDEGKASGMPAEPSLRTGPQSNPRRTTERPWDLIDEIKESIGKIRGLKSSKPGEEGYYPDAYRESLKYGPVRDLYSNRSGAQSLDSVVDTLRRTGIVKDDFTVDDLHDALIKAAKARQGFRKGQTAESRQLKREEAQRVDFEKVAMRPKADAKGKADGIVVNELLPGDEFTLAGAKVRVRELSFDPETAELSHVVLEDGRRFGVQSVDADQVIYADGGSVKMAPRPTDFIPEGTPSRPIESINRELNALRAKPERTAFDEQRMAQLEHDLGQQDLLNVPQSRTAADVEAEKDRARQQAEIAAGQAARLTAPSAEQQPLLPEEGDQGAIHFASAGAAPARPAAGAGLTAPSAPGLKTAAVPVPPAAVPRGTTAPGRLRNWWQGVRKDILKLVAPQAIDGMARRVGNIVREYNAEAALKPQQLDAELAQWRRSFDRTPVPRDWVYDPAAPLPRNYAFIDESEHGGRSLGPQEQQLKAQIDAMFGEMVDDVHAVAPRALQNLIQDYFAHLWRDPRQATRVFNEILSKRPLEGSKAFLKQRTKRYFRDGLEAGLVPVSDNPIDVVLQKAHELRKFIAAQKILQEAKDIGARKFVYVFERPPEGWTRVNDPTTAVYAPPFVTVQEAFDAQLRTKTTELLQKLGIPHERVAKMRGKRWGESNDLTGEIKTRFAGPDEVIWHELGHQLEARYGMSKLLADTAQKQAELTALAKLREAPGFKSASFRKYAQTLDEKMATVVQAYVHAPDLFDRTAPTVAHAFRDFIQSHPELRDIDEIQPSLQLGTAKASYPVGGMVTLGHWYMPEGGAAVLNNYLSPGLGRFGLVRTIRAGSNLLNGAQLGFSAFHVGFTSLDAAVSRAAVGLEYLADGRPIAAAMKLLSVPIAPATNWRTGLRLQREMLHPGSEGPEMAKLSQLAVAGGLRATIDPFWKTEITRKMVRAFHQGGVLGYGETALRLPFAAVEQLIRPIAEWVVPRQKLGVFADMAKLAMDRLGPNATHEQIREAMAQAADSTENRMGQMTYDNLFYNRIIKDAALTGFRAYGWQLGKYREAFGAAFDTGRQVGRAVTLQRPELTHRMAYALALPMVVGTMGGLMNYLFTGEPPKEWRDAFFPRTGKVDENGRAQRLMLPSYLKDLISDWHDFPNIKKMGASFYHKLNPWSAVSIDMLRNQDFYGVRVYNEDDPALAKAADLAKFALKSATPFSVTGAMKLREDQGAGPLEWVLPFFGVVPAKKALTMTPAEGLASDIMAGQMEVGSRTREEYDRTKLLRKLVQDTKADRETGINNITGAVQSGAIRPADVAARIIPRLKLTPMQYQIQAIRRPADAMRVWDLANPQEREDIRNQLLMKIARSKTLEPEEQRRFVDVIVNNKQTKP